MYVISDQFCIRKISFIILSLDILNYFNIKKIEKYIIIMINYYNYIYN